LSLKIPFDQCDVLDERLTSMTATYYETLESIDDDLQPPKPIVIVQNGITLRFSLCEIPIYNKETREKVPTKFVNITLSAKLLKEYYFEGINKFNIKYLYKYLLDFCVIHFSFETLLNSNASDVDICINRYCGTAKIFLASLECLKSQSGTKDKFFNIIDTPNNIGLAINDRHRAKPSLPFIKLYHKENELLSKSLEFYQTYLEKEFARDIKGLTRFEATIRNYEHKKRLERFGILPNFKTLGELLEIPQENLYDFCVFSMNSYVETKARQKAPNLSPTDHIIYELLQNCILKGYDYKSLLNIVEDFKGSSAQTTSVARSRMRSKITELYDLLVFKDVKIQQKANHNSHVLEYLNFLNIKL